VRTSAGEVLATTSYLLDLRLAGAHYQHHLFRGMPRPAPKKIGLAGLAGAKG
jgi:hypothetical protein